MVSKPQSAGTIMGQGWCQQQAKGFGYLGPLSTWVTRRAPNNPAGLLRSLQCWCYSELSWGIQEDVRIDQPLRALVISVVPWTGWERPGHRSTSCLERKHYCKLSKELKMENSTLSCEGTEGNSSWLGPGWDWVSWPSHLPSLCLFPSCGMGHLHPPPKLWGTQPRTRPLAVFTGRMLAPISSSGPRSLVWLYSLSAHLASWGLRLSRF